MEPALKQRMMGAAVLVALAIIFLPMVFDGPAPPAPSAGSLPLTVPEAPDRPLQTREIPLTLPARAPAPTPAATAPPDDSGKLATVDVAVVPRTEVPDPSPSTVAAVPEEVATVASSSSSAAALPTPTPSPIETPTTTPTEAPAPTEPAPSGSRFVINLGSYANAANAKALESSLKQAGVPVYVEPIDLDGKPASRLRAGPYPSRAAAESAIAGVRRVKSDLPVAVIGLDADEAAPRSAPSAVAGGFVVQVAAFASEAEADTLRDRLRKGGYAAYTERVAREQGALWRVRVGPEIQRAKADQLRADLRQKYQLQGQVLSHP